MTPPEDGDEDGFSVRGQGSGFLITADGYALTNHHVVENATRITVFVGDDHTEIPAEVVGSDEKSDVALIKLQSDRKDFPFLPLGDSDRLAVGDFVAAIGSPFGLEQSVSLGIVSARGRRDIAPSGRQGLYDFLQTDASINPGNSGGPLLDMSGAAVGINSAVNAAGSGIGFAIPINMVKRMLPSLQKIGRYERSWLGVSILSVTPELARGLGLPRAAGALVREVVKDGPAAQAGVLPGDVIVTFGKTAIRDAAELPLVAGDAGIDTKVPVELVRDGKKQTLQLTLGSHPDNARRAEARPQPQPRERPRDKTIGVGVVSIDDEVRVRLGLERKDGGARVTRVRPGSAAFLAGLGEDDVILRVDGKPIANADAFATAVKAAPGGSVLRLDVRRGDSALFVPLVKP
jgi:serine protease Do